MSFEQLLIHFRRASVFKSTLTLTQMNNFLTKKKKTDFIVKHSLAISRPMKEKNKKIHRKFAQHSFAFSDEPSAFLFFILSLVFIFHFSCRRTTSTTKSKKGYKWIERENNLLILVGFDAALSQHFNPFVTIFDARMDHFCALCLGEGEWGNDLFVDTHL
jgi:hypothetical protein